MSMVRKPRTGRRRRVDPEPRPGGRRRAPRILVVEDEPEARRALQLLLEFDSYEVAAAADGDAALRTFERFRPHLVVMDWRLPGPSGRELHDALQRRRRGSRVPVVIVSSADEAFDPRHRCGVARLRKPLNVPLFRAVVAANVAK